MTTHKLTIEDVAGKSIEDHVPPIGDLWKRIGGQDKELEKLLAVTFLTIEQSKTRAEKIDALSGLMIFSSIVGYYGNGVCQVNDGKPPC